MVKKTVCVFAGDGVGPEVTAEAIKILHVVEKHTDLEIDFQHKLMGGCAIDATGNPLPDDSLACAKAADAVLLGAVGGPKWGTGKVRPEQGTVPLNGASDNQVYLGFERKWIRSPIYVPVHFQARAY